MIRSAAGANPGPGWHGVPKRKPPTLNPVPVNPVPVFPVPDVQRAAIACNILNGAGVHGILQPRQQLGSDQEATGGSQADRCGALGNSTRSIA